MMFVNSMLAPFLIGFLGFFAVIYLVKGLVRMLGRMLTGKGGQRDKSGPDAVERP